jgi:hypothetical protein
MGGNDHDEAYTAIVQGELLSPEIRKLAEAEPFGDVEGHACGAVMRGAVVLPGSKGPHHVQKDRAGNWEIS